MLIDVRVAAAGGRPAAAGFYSARGHNRGLAPDDLCDRFYDCWTLKEADLKARGLGLRLPLDQFAILFSGHAIGISFTREIDDDPKRWHCTRHSPSPQHRLAIADGSGTPGGLPITMRPWPVPLV